MLLFLLRNPFLFFFSPSTTPRWYDENVLLSTRGGVSTCFSILITLLFWKWTFYYGDINVSQQPNLPFEKMPILNRGRYFLKFFFFFCGRVPQNQKFEKVFFYVFLTRDRFHWFDFTKLLVGLYLCHSRLILFDISSDTSIIITSKFTISGNTFVSRIIYVHGYRCNLFLTNIIVK